MGFCNRYHDIFWGLTAEPARVEMMDMTAGVGWVVGCGPHIVHSQQGDTVGDGRWIIVQNLSQRQILFHSQIKSDYCNI